MEFTRATWRLPTERSPKMSASGCASNIHRQRKEWDAREKEMVAYRLVDLLGRAGAANIPRITVRELDKLVEVYELSGRFTALRDPSAAITWARELMGVSKKLLVPTVVDAVVKKVNDKRITNSKDLRKLRMIEVLLTRYANCVKYGFVVTFFFRGSNPEFTRFKSD